MEIKGTLTLADEALHNPDPRVLRLQRELKALADRWGRPDWDPGRLDGKLGGENSNTRRALSNFAKWRNSVTPKPTWKGKEVVLPEDGTLDEALAAYLNVHFYEQTKVGKVVQQREASLRLKEGRIRGIRAELEREGLSAKRKIELRERLHKWLERKAKELEADEFDGVKGYEQVAFVVPPEHELLIELVEGLTEAELALLADFSRAEDAQPIVYVSDLLQLGAAGLALTLEIEPQRAERLLALARDLQVANGEQAQDRLA